MPYKNPYIFKTKSYTVSEKPILASFKTKSKAQKFIGGLKGGESYAESPKAVSSNSSKPYKETYGKIDEEDDDLYEDGGKFEIISSEGAGDTGENLANVEGYYTTSKGKVYFKKDLDKFYVKGQISSDSKAKLGELIDDRYLDKLSEFD